MNVSRLKVSYRWREAGGMTVKLWVRTSFPSRLTLHPPLSTQRVVKEV
jgi:hypothetical protein